MTKYIIENRYITPFFSDKFKFIPDKKERTNFFERNKTYLLTGLDCDGFSMPAKRYKYVGSINEVDGIRLNSVIMKQIGGEPTTIFSLTKSDCKSFGIEFESGLQLFPNNLNWVRENVTEEKKEISFDSSNLSTYPVDFNDKTIHFMIIKLSGFSYDERFHRIIAPNGCSIHESTFSRSLSVRTLQSIGVAHNMNETCIGANECIPYRIITNKASRVKSKECFVDIGGCVFIELCFEQYINNVKRGINPKYFSNESFDKFFEIELSINDSNSYDYDKVRSVVSIYDTQYNRDKFIKHLGDIHVPRMNYTNNPYKIPFDEDYADKLIERNIKQISKILNKFNDINYGY